MQKNSQVNSKKKKKKNDEQRAAPSDFKTYYNDTVIKMVIAKIEQKRTIPI